MNDNERLDLYFNRQADRIALPDGDPARIVASAQRRRQRRRTISGATAAAVLVIGVLGLYAGRGETRLNVAGVPTTDGSSPTAASLPALTWSTVDVPLGLGWDRSPVTTDDGSLYSLSTAPGRPANGTWSASTTLYRSTDGRTWATAPLPSGMRAAALAATPGHLYALGTAPAGGGGVDLVVASSTDHATTWTEARLPSAAATLMARYPTDVHVSPPSLTSGPNGIVAAIVVSASPDARRLFEAKGIPYPENSSRTEDGVLVYQDHEAPSCLGPSGAAVPPNTAPPGTATSGTAVPPGTTVDRSCVPREPIIDRTYSWAELGLEPELQALLKGQVHVFRSTDGTTFTESAPTGLEGFAPLGVDALIGSVDGYRMLLATPRESMVTQVYSPDGITWTRTGATSGWVQSVGLLRGTPAAIVAGDAPTTLLRAAPGGGWTATELAVGLRAAGVSDQALHQTAIGPLGLVGLSWSDDADVVAVVTSTDGTTFAARPLADLAGAGNWSLLGITMNADAVILRLTPRSEPVEGDPDPSTVPIPPQRLLVGTRS